jgi:hypothetical protein
MLPRMHDAKKIRHTRSTLTMKAMMDTTLTLQTRSMPIPLTMTFTLLMESLTMTNCSDS